MPYRTHPRPKERPLHWARPLPKSWFSPSARQEQRLLGKDFFTGHDQTALHNRVRQIGTGRRGPSADAHRPARAGR